MIHRILCAGINRVIAKYVFILDTNRVKIQL